MLKNCIVTYVYVCVCVCITVYILYINLIVYTQIRMQHKYQLLAHYVICPARQQVSFKLTLLTAISSKFHFQH